MKSCHAMMNHRIRQNRWTLNLNGDQLDAELGEEHCQLNRKIQMKFQWIHMIRKKHQWNRWMHQSSHKMLRLNRWTQNVVPPDRSTGFLDESNRLKIRLRNQPTRLIHKIRLNHKIHS